jgi:hypothetical protein
VRVIPFRSIFGLYVIASVNTLAVCMYEFMCGAVPFGENAEDPMDVYLSIVNE